jgi:hypothetical protein
MNKISHRGKLRMIEPSAAKQVVIHVSPIGGVDAGRFLRDTPLQTST